MILCKMSSRLAMLWKRGLLCLLILAMGVFVLQYMVLMKHKLSTYGLFGLVQSQIQFLGSSVRVDMNHTMNDTSDQFASGSRQSQFMADLKEFAKCVREPTEWMNGVSHSQHSIPFPTVSAVNCTKIWGNDEQELRAAHNYQKSHGRQLTKSVRHYLQETANCTSYLLNGGFLLASVDKNELSFPLAYSLAVYKDVEQVERLLRAVYRPHNVYCIHPDRMSSDDFHSSLRFIAGCLPNVNIVERPLSVKWGKYSVLQADVECMKLLWHGDVKWRYFINLTGQEFPLKTNKEIVRILQTYNGANDISGVHNPTYTLRWRKYLPAPYNVTISKGDVHIVASRGYVDYALNSRVARDFYKWVAPTFIPDETFFSTLNHNPQLGVPGSYTGEANDETRDQFLRYKIWLSEISNLARECAGKKVRGICHFGVGDIPRMVVSPHLFANKFSYDYMPLAYDCVEEWYWHKVHLENVGQAPELNLTRYEMSTIVRNRYNGPVKIWE